MKFVNRELEYARGPPFQSALVYNIESMIATCRLEPGLINGCNVSIGWALSQRLAEFRYCVIRAFSDCLNRTVRQIADRPDYARMGGGPDCEIAVANPLDSSLGHESSRYLHSRILRSRPPVRTQVKGAGESRNDHAKLRNGGFAPLLKRGATNEGVADLSVNA